MPIKKMLDAVTPQTLNKIYTHPFNIELCHGTLPQKKYQAFLEQDRLYLTELAKAFSQTAARLPLHKHQHLFHQISDYVLEGQMNLHQKYLLSHKTPNLFQPAPLETSKLPVIAHYTDHLLATTKNAPIEIAITSLLPCFYIYSHLGMQMRSTVKATNPYRRWIDSYSSERFLLFTQLILQTLTELHREIETPDEKKLIAAFLKSTEFEIAFWDTIYGAPYEHKNETTLTR